MLSGNCWAAGHAFGHLTITCGSSDMSYTLTEDVGKDPRYRDGVKLPGYDVQCRGRWFEFDGRKLHSTREYRGNRCSLVYFICKRYAAASPTMRMGLGDAGFNFLWSDAVMQTGAVPEATMKAEHTEKLSEPRNPAAARRAVQDFLKVNTNQKGGGGMALYHSHLSKLRKALKNVASPQQIEAEALLEAMASKDNFQGKTPGTCDRDSLGVICSRRLLTNVPRLCLGPAMSSAASTSSTAMFFLIQGLTLVHIPSSFL
jgi:hypothetical protein